MKQTTFKVNTMSEFQEMVNKKDFNISQAIVESILSNLKSRKKNVHMLSVKCIDEDVIIDITLEKSNFADTLKENLKHYEKHEKYEECEKIRDGIAQLTKTK
jgi:protein-arginine kinase activator protein McsA